MTQLGISRTTLYTCIDQGQLRATPAGFIDQTECVRIAPLLDVHRERPRPPMDMATMDASTSHSAHHRRPVDMPRRHTEQAFSKRQLTSTYRNLVDILREQLQAAQERERDYRLAWTRAWLIRVWGCCAMGSCSAWSEGGM